MLSIVAIFFTSNSANGISRINFNYTATSIKPNTETPTEMEVAGDYRHII